MSRLETVIYLFSGLKRKVVGKRKNTTLCIIEEKYKKSR